MSRKILSLAVIAAAVSLTLGSSEVQAKHCRSHHRHHGCQQTSNCGYQTNTVGCQQTVNSGCQQASRCAPQSTCGNVRPVCCVAQPAYATSAPAGFDAPPPAPAVQALPPAPASGG